MKKLTNLFCEIAFSPIPVQSCPVSVKSDRVLSCRKSIQAPVGRSPQDSGINLPKRVRPSVRAVAATVSVVSSKPQSLTSAKVWAIVERNLGHKLTSMKIGDLK